MTAQLFAPLAPEIEAALKASIQRFGVIVPVVEDQNGNVIDGRHRRRLAEELGVTCRVDQVQVADEAEALEVQRTLNADRRQMTTEQRREIELELRKEGHSYRAIAGAVGVDPKTVRNDARLATGDMSPVQFPERSRGLDGKSRPATRASWMPLPTSKPMRPPRRRPDGRPIDEVLFADVMTQIKAIAMVALTKTLTVTDYDRGRVSEYEKALTDINIARRKLRARLGEMG